MDSVDQTLRKAREVEERFKKFMQKRVEQDKSIQQTLNKIDRAQETLKETRETIGTIDKLYTRLQEVLSKSIDVAVNSIQKHTLFNVAEVGYVPKIVDSKRVAEQMRKRKKILILTGAGMSVASGIPTFRGDGGFWSKQKIEFDPNDPNSTVAPQIILTYAFYQKHPQRTWQWIEYFYAIKEKAKPNKGHIALSQILQDLAEKGRQVCMVTQNIDNFHPEVKEQRRNKNKKLKNYPIYEIHGNITKIRCDSCSHKNNELIYDSYEKNLKILKDFGKVKCPNCQNYMRPHVMLFDQFYDQIFNQSETVNDFLKEADMIIVIGTALQTGLASTIVQKALQKDVTVVQLNLQCQIKRSKVLWLRGKAEQSLQKIRFDLWKE